MDNQKHEVFMRRAIALGPTERQMIAGRNAAKLYSIPVDEIKI